MPVIACIRIKRRENAVVDAAGAAAAVLPVKVSKILEIIKKEVTYTP